MMRYVLVNGLSMLNALCGLAAMAALIIGEGPERLRWSALLLLAGMVPDVLDGIAARALDAASRIGAQLDVNADTVTFNVATAALILSAPWALGVPAGHPATLGAALAASAYLCAGLWRSARLVTLEDPPTARRHFWGMTTNLASFTVGATVFLGEALGLEAAQRVWALSAVALVVSPAMVSRVLYPDVIGQLLKGQLPRWPVLVLLAAVPLTGPEIPWAACVFGCALWPPLLQLMGRQPAPARRSEG